MKIKGNGQAKVLTSDELRLLFTEGLVTERDRCLFAIQEISGHNDLGTLQRYLEVTPEQRQRALALIKI